MPTLEEIRSDFALLDDWEDRYRYVIELGRSLPPLAEAERTEANKVRGCASQVWLSRHSAASADGWWGTWSRPVLTGGPADARSRRPRAGCPR